MMVYRSSCSAPEDISQKNLEALDTTYQNSNKRRSGDEKLGKEGEPSLECDGKGKHGPTCKCNICLMVSRRFKILMMRKKRRQSDREAESLTTLMNVVSLTSEMYSGQTSLLSRPVGGTLSFANRQTGEGS